MPINQLDNKRIAKNTLMLYIRMLMSIVVSLYTSRVVLATLGVEDYGIYGVVGGVVSMFTFINASMAGATSRFLTYEMGKASSLCDRLEGIHDKKKEVTRLEKTFSSSVLIHVCIAIVILFLACTIGLWFLSNKLVIPEARVSAAFVVYICSIISMFFTVTQVPYNAAIIAHEKMDIYAYIEILNVLLKLGIVYLLLICEYDKLILYALLSLFVSVFIAMLYRMYCLKHFSETHFHFIYDKSILKPILVFSGWDLFGSMSIAVSQQGYPFAMNMIAGPALNAANNIANTVMGTIKGLGYTVVHAFRPQIIKAYAEGDINRMQQLVINSTKLCLAILIIFVLPVYYEAEYVLELWLVKVPAYTVELLKVALVCLVFNMSNVIINIPIHATGNVKNLSLYTGICYTLSPFAYYLICKIGVSSVSAYWTIVFIAVVTLFITICILKNLIRSFCIFKLIKWCYVPLIPMFLIDCIICTTLKVLLPLSFCRLILVISLSTITISLYVFVFMLTKYQREFVMKRFLHFIKIIF